MRKNTTIDEIETSFISRNKGFVLFDEDEIIDDENIFHNNSESNSESNSENNLEISFTELNPRPYNNKRKKVDKYKNYFSTSSKENHLNCNKCKRDIKFIEGKTSTGNLWTHGKTCFNKDKSNIIESPSLSEEKINHLNNLFLKVIL